MGSYWLIWSGSQSKFFVPATRRLSGLVELEVAVVPPPEPCLLVGLSGDPPRTPRGRGPPGVRPFRRSLAAGADRPRPRCRCRPRRRSRSLTSSARRGRGCWPSRSVPDLHDVTVTSCAGGTFGSVRDRANTGLLALAPTDTRADGRRQSGACHQEIPGGRPCPWLSGRSVSGGLRVLRRCSRRGF